MTTLNSKEEIVYSCKWEILMGCPTPEGKLWTNNDVMKGTPEWTAGQLMSHECSSSSSWFYSLRGGTDVMSPSRSVESERETV